MAVKELDLDLIPMLKNVDIRAKRKVLSRVLEGSWTAMLKGRGMEFAGFRTYTYGDDASMIDWGATLRSKDTLIREFEEYKNITVILALDVCDSMLFTSTTKLKAEHGAELLFNLATAIAENGDAVGFTMFNDQVLSKVEPGIGKNVIYRIANALQQPKNYGGKHSLKPLLQFMESSVKQRALILLISDFMGLEDGWERYIRALGQKYDLIGVRLVDPRDQELPDTATQILVTDPFTHEQLIIDTKQYKQLYQDSIMEQNKKIKNVFDKAEAGLLSVNTGEDPFPALFEYFRKRTAIMKN